MFIADLHIHSKYSRATSKDCVPEMLELWARRKGLDLIGTGDFTHPAWREELSQKLEPAEEGLYRLKNELQIKEKIGGREIEPRFILSGEISSIYKKNGKVRKVHNVILLPSLEAAEELALKLEAIGNLHSDGRPILGLDSRDLLEITLETCPQAIFIPAHIWTPHFSLFGAYSGFDAIEECFEDLTPYIHALETGLSSDPPMNWRLSALDRFAMVSNSDAHSPANLAREANLFDTQLSYPAIAHALENPNSREFFGTIEFFPEEGKYHCDGHRNCKVCLKPSETNQLGGKCPVCGKRITVGVLHRVEDLADRPEGYRPDKGRYFESLVPLREVLAWTMNCGVASQKVNRKYLELLGALGSELEILRHTPLEEIEEKAGLLTSQSIRHLREGKVDASPGFDGEYGKIQPMTAKERQELEGQMSFLGMEEAPKKSSVKSAGRAAAKEVAREEQQAQEALKNSQPSAHYGLNAQQWQAASCMDSAVAVIAGPGTGKTRTLVCRIAHLVEQNIALPTQLTAVTFTNKAAGEMKERLEQHFGDKKTASHMNIGTFHALCLKLLTQWKESRSLISQGQALHIASQVIQRLGRTKGARELLQQVSRVKNGMDLDISQADRQAVELYCQQLAKSGCMDFDDILLRTVELLESGRELPEKWRQSLCRLLVDEFQDINPVQYRLIRQWSKWAKCLFVIGDPDQSIYGFRGSDAHCFERLAQDFAPVTQINLIENYRSTPEILRCALSVISADGLQRQLKANRSAAKKVRLLTANSPMSEGIFVAQEISRLIGGVDMLEAHHSKKVHLDDEKTWGLSDIAILYRTHHQEELLEQCLKQGGIPYTVWGKGEYLDDPQVGSCLNFFEFLLNPGNIGALNAYLEAEQVGSGFISGLLPAYESRASKDIPSFLELLEEMKPKDTFGQVAPLESLVQQFAPSVKKEKPLKLIEQWVEEKGLQNQKAMERLICTSVLYRKMQEMTQQILLGQEGDILRSGTRKYLPNAVQLLTLHGAKGLEYPVVFLCGVNQGTIPLESSGKVADMEEERRLFYVGMTRAQEELILLTSPEPSLFLQDIPADQLLAGAAMERRKKDREKQLSFF